VNLLHDNKTLRLQIRTNTTINKTLSAEVNKCHVTAERERLIQIALIDAICLR